MSERKVLNKYFPPDFDPSKITRRKLGGNRQQVVRLMAPFSMRCNTCGEYIYKGKKFNARKETAEGETYFGIKIFRFYIKCTQCSAEITFKTDPKNTDYVAEHGAARNFEPWRDSGDSQETEEERLSRLEEELKADPMEALENKTVDSKREMDILDKLQEIKVRNARNERADRDTVLGSVNSRQAVAGVDYEVGDENDEERRRREEAEDEAEVRRVFARLIPQDAEVGPTIELDEPLSSEEDGQEESDAFPPASTSQHAHPPSIQNESSTPGQPKVGVVKRKMGDEQPDAMALLSEDARQYAALMSVKSATQLPPAKKKKKDQGSMASKLGIKLAPKVTKRKQ